MNVIQVTALLIRVLYLRTLTTPIWNRKCMLSCFIPGNKFENKIGEQKQNC